MISHSAYQALLALANLPENQKFNLRWECVVRTAVSKMGDGKTALADELVNGARSLQKDFPNRQEPSELVLAAARRSDSGKAAQLTAEILNRPGSDEVKRDAQGLLAKILAKIRPVEMEFTTIEGKKINLRTLKGNVVLLHFWSTASAKPRGHLAFVKKAFDKYHARGLEAIGINFDLTDALIRESVKRGDIAWPQVLNVPSAKGTPWRDYGIDSLPVIWLLDGKGVLREYNAGADLAKKVEALLAEP